MQHLYPQPTTQGIARTQKFYKSHYGRDVTEDEARQILLRIIRFLYLSAHPLSPEEAQRLKELRQAEGEIEPSVLNPPMPLDVPASPPQKPLTSSP
jgi:hypothetical protein